MNSINNYGLEKIKVSDKLDDVIQSSVKKAIHDKNKKRKRINSLKYGSAAASLLAAFVLSINISPAFAESMKDIPIISSMSDALRFHYDRNITNAEKQNIAETKQNKGISITIDNIVTDDKELFILYTLDGKLNKDNLKDLLVDKFALKDSNDKIILDSDGFKSPILPEKLSGKDGDYLLFSTREYKCIVSSLGSSIDNYSANKKTYGSIELISVSDSSKIPNEIKLDVSGLTEAYNANFASKFNREPVNIQGNWNFSIKANNNLKSKKPEEYSNINFSVNNTDFTLEDCKIYPAHISTRIKLGKNKLDKSRCWAIGRISGNDNSKLPYLMDESGNKYFISGNALTGIDSNNCINLSFESCYFNKPKHLYLVISQLNYMPGAPFINIDPIKVKIK